MSRNLGFIFYTFAVPISTLAGYGFATSFQFINPLLKYINLKKNEK